MSSRGEIPYTVSGDVFLIVDCRCQTRGGTLEEQSASEDNDVEWEAADGAYYPRRLKDSIRPKVFRNLNNELSRLYTETLFGGLSYVVELTRRFEENESRSFSLFFNADSQETFNPIVLFSEQEIIGRVLSHETAFKQVDAIDAQWYPIVERYCKENGIDISRIPPAPAVPSANTGRSV